MPLVSIFWRVVASIIGSNPARWGWPARDDLAPKPEERSVQWSLFANCIPSHIEGPQSDGNRIEIFKSPNPPLGIKLGRPGSGEGQTDY